MIAQARQGTYGSVGGLLLLVTLLVSGSLGLVGLLLLLVQALPLLAEKLADLAYEDLAFTKISGPELVGTHRT